MPSFSNTFFGGFERHEGNAICFHILYSKKADISTAVISRTLENSQERLNSTTFEAIKYVFFGFGETVFEVLYLSTDFTILDICLKAVTKILDGWQRQNLHQDVVMTCQSSVR